LRGQSHATARRQCAGLEVVRRDGKGRSRKPRVRPRRAAACGTYAVAREGRVHVAARVPHARRVHAYGATANVRSDSRARPREKSLSHADAERRSSRSGSAPTISSQSTRSALPAQAAARSAYLLATFRFGGQSRLARSNRFLLSSSGPWPGGPAFWNRTTTKRTPPRPVPTGKTTALHRALSQKTVCRITLSLVSPLYAR